MNKEQEKITNRVAKVIIAFIVGALAISIIIAVVFLIVCLWEYILNLIVNENISYFILSIIGVLISYNIGKHILEEII